MISGKSALRAGALAVAVVVADQATKSLVRHNVRIGSSDGIFPGVQLVHVHNRGVAFGLFVNGGVLLVIIGVAGAGPQHGLSGHAARGPRSAARRRS